MRLLAIKPLKYGTRRLMAGETFDCASPREARLLLAIKRARQDDAPIEQARPVETPAPIPTPAPPADPAADELKAAREAYEAAIGRKPFHGWSAEVLRTKIAEAQAGDDA